MRQIQKRPQIPRPREMLPSISGRIEAIAAGKSLKFTLFLRIGVLSGAPVEPVEGPRCPAKRLSLSKRALCDITHSQGRDRHGCSETFGLPRRLVTLKARDDPVVRCEDHPRAID